MVKLRDHDFPDVPLYNIDNQIWYEPLRDGSVRAGFTSWAVNLMGEVLVHPEADRTRGREGTILCLLEGGKWAGLARAAFDGVVVAHNDLVIHKPELLNQDPYGQGWMLTVRPALLGWRDGLVTGAAIGPTFHAWLGTRAYTDGTE